MKRVIRQIFLAGVFAQACFLTGCFFTGPCVQGYGPVVVEERDLEDFSAVSNTGSFDVRVEQSDRYSIEVEAQENLLPLLETYVSGSTLVVKTRNGTCINSAAPVVVYVTLPVLDELQNTGSGRLMADRSESPEFILSNSGSGRVTVDSVFASFASLKNTGSGEVWVTYLRTGESELVQTGSGDLDAGMIDGNGILHINHTSSGRVYAILLDGVELETRLSGSGRVELWGDAVLADYFLSSSGRIDALELVSSEVTASITGSGKVYVNARDRLDVTITSSGDLLYRGNPVVSARITGSGRVLPY